MTMGGVLWFFSAKRQLIAAYLLCSLPCGIFMAMVMPPGQAPDERNHMVRAEGLLHGAILAVRHLPRTGIETDAGLLRIATGMVTEIDGRSVETLADYYALRNQTASHLSVFAGIPNTAAYFPAAYLPSAVGLALGLAIKASPFICMILARLGMLAAAVSLGCLALRLAAYGEPLLLCTLLMPMTLSLAGCLNVDGVLIGLACLSAAAMTRDMSASRFRLLALLPLVVICGTKPPYLPLLGLTLLPLNAAGLWRKLRDMVLGAAPVLLWIGLITTFVVVPFRTAPYHPGPLYAGDHGIILRYTDWHANLQILLTRPALFVWLPWQLLCSQGGWLLWQMIGILGQLALVFPPRFYHAWTAAIMIALIGLVFPRRRSAGAPRPYLQSIYVVLLLILVAWAVAITQFLSWSLVGSGTIVGVQGRYFLLLLPFLLASVPNGGGAWKVPPIVPALPAIALGIYDLGYLPLKIVSFYYMY